MEFVNYPPKLSPLRSDCCTFLKSENGAPISLKMKTKSFSKRILIIRILMNTKPNYPHFYKLFRIDKKSQTEEVKRSTKIYLKENEDSVQLDFFGIRKSTKEQAMKYIKENFNETDNYEQIFKENSSITILEITLIDEVTGQKDKLFHTIHVGKPESEEIKVFSYTPKTIYDGEITICLTKKIKEDNSIYLEMLDPIGKYKTISQPAKNVLVYKIPLKNIPFYIERFSARLISGDNMSEIMFFEIRRSETENLKRKATFIDENHSENKIYRSLSNSTFESNEVDICSDKKYQVKEMLTRRFLREIARVGHDFAFGKEVTNRMRDIMTNLPVVCILQDDIGDTPLNNAILKGNEERASDLVDIIITKFPDEINLKNTSGHTALILAPACDVSSHFIMKLMKSGANLLDADCDGSTAFSIAIQYHKLDVLNLLLVEAYNQNLLNTLDCHSLVKEAIQYEFFNGLQILSYYHPFNELCCESFLDSDQLHIYKEVMQNLHESPLDTEEITAIPENISEDLDLFIQCISENSFEN